MQEPVHMTNVVSGADFSSLLYVKSNTFKIEREKKIKTRKRILHLQHFCTSNK